MTRDAESPRSMCSRAPSKGGGPGCWCPPRVRCPSPSLAGLFTMPTPVIGIAVGRKQMSIKIKLTEGQVLVIRADPEAWARAYRHALENDSAVEVHRSDGRTLAINPHQISCSGRRLLTRRGRTQLQGLVRLSLHWPGERLSNSPPRRASPALKPNGPFIRDGSPSAKAPTVPTGCYPPTLPRCGPTTGVRSKSLGDLATAARPPTCSSSARAPSPTTLRSSVAPDRRCAPPWRSRPLPERMRA